MRDAAITWFLFRKLANISVPACVHISTNRVEQFSNKQGRAIFKHQRTSMCAQQHKQGRASFKQIGQSNFQTNRVEQFFKHQRTSMCAQQHKQGRAIFKQIGQSNFPTLAYQHVCTATQIGQRNLQTNAAWEVNHRRDTIILK